MTNKTTTMIDKVTSTARRKISEMMNTISSTPKGKRATMLKTTPKSKGALQGEDVMVVDQSESQGVTLPSLASKRPLTNIFKKKCLGGSSATSWFAFE